MKRTKWLAILLAAVMSVTSLAACEGPQGEPGTPGIQGERGPEGPQGDKGDRGPEGLQGAQGEQGDKGDRGPEGPQGAQGPQGDKGDRGPEGPQGAQGPQGDKGDTGAQGEKGDKGDTGAQGEKGDKGDTGAQGEKGDKGDRGPEGPQGAQGPQGEQGIQGVQGEKGDIGITGQPGTDGREVVFRVHEGWMQWKYENDTEWINLYEVPPVVKPPKLMLIVNGGKMPEGALSEFEVTEGTVIQLPTPTKEGYVFFGWFTEGGEEPVPMNYTVVKTEYLRAVWGVADYTLTFDQESAGQTISPYTYTYGDTDALPLLDKTGYCFNGWCVESDFSDEPIMYIPKNFHGNKTLYAKFTAYEYTVNLHADGANLTESNVNVTFDQNYVLPVPTKEHYTFTGWYTEAEGGTMLADADGRSVSAYNVPFNTECYAQWKINEYTITFDTADGENIEPAVYVYNSKVSSFPEATKYGYLFKGWYFDADCTQAAPSELTVTGDLTLYANFMQSKAISTLEELKTIAANPYANYHLTADINMNGEKWEPIGYFGGLLDGMGHKIHNFTISGSERELGFIKNNDGTVQNLTLEDFIFDISTSNIMFNAGVLAGVNNGTIQNCKVLDGVASYTYFHYANGGSLQSNSGGIVGYNANRIIDCEVSINMSSTVSSQHDDDWASSRETDLYVSIFVGPVAGTNAGTIEQCNASSNIQFSTGPSKRDSWNYRYIAAAESIISGFVAKNTGEIHNCSCDVLIQTTTGGGTDSATFNIGMAGGFVCSNAGIINECFAKSQIIDELGYHTTLRVGGFVCYNSATVNNCYADTVQKANGIGNINSQHGGFVYENTNTITNCYAIGSIESAVTAGIASFVGHNSISGVISKCFSSCSIKATNGGAVTGYFVAVADGGSTTFKCYYDQNQTITVNGVQTIPTNQDGTAAALSDFYGAGLVVEKLSWPTDVWHISDDALPTLRWQQEIQ